MRTNTQRWPSIRWNKYAMNKYPGNWLGPLRRSVHTYQAGTASVNMVLVGEDVFVLGGPRSGPTSFPGPRSGPPPAKSICGTICPIYVYKDFPSASEDLVNLCMCIWIEVKQGMGWHVQMVPSRSILFQGFRNVGYFFDILLFSTFFCDLKMKLEEHVLQKCLEINFWPLFRTLRTEKLQNPS